MAARGIDSLQALPKLTFAFASNLGEYNDYWVQCKAINHLALELDTIYPSQVMACCRRKCSPIVI